MSIAHQTVEVDGCFNGIVAFLKSGTLSKHETFLRLSHRSGCVANYRDGHHQEDQYEFHLVQKTNGTYLKSAVNLVFEQAPWSGSENNWLLVFHFGTAKQGGIKTFRKTPITLNPSSTNAAPSSSILIGTVSEVLQHLESGDAEDELHFKMTASRQATKFPGGVLDTQRELVELKKAMSRLQSTITSLNRPSHEVTCLVFHSPRRQTVKKLYVLSDLLTKYEYFRACHSSDYSEAQISGGSPSQQSNGMVEKNRVEHNEDSDDEWDIDEEEPEETHTKFKATIQITGTSRRTYKAFVDYALCGALYFSPPLSSYGSYLLQVEPGKVKLAWPEWANERGTSHTSVPGFKTFTSAKSMWRMADMLIIPELKAICQAKIISSLKVETVVQELQSELFRTHVDFRLKAYEFVRENWRDVVHRGGIERMLTNLSTTEAKIISDSILRRLPL